MEAAIPSPPQPPAAAAPKPKHKKKRLSRALSKLRDKLHRPSRPHGTEPQTQSSNNYNHYTPRGDTPTLPPGSKLSDKPLTPAATAISPQHQDPHRQERENASSTASRSAKPVPGDNDDDDVARVAELLQSLEAAGDAANRPSSSPSPVKEAKPNETSSNEQTARRSNSVTAALPPAPASQIPDPTKASRAAGPTPTPAPSSPVPGTELSSSQTSITTPDGTVTTDPFYTTPGYEWASKRNRPASQSQSPSTKPEAQRSVSWEQRMRYQRDVLGMSQDQIRRANSRPAGIYEIDVVADGPLIGSR